MDALLRALGTTRRRVRSGLITNTHSVAILLHSTPYTHTDWPAPMKRNISPHATASWQQLQTSGDARAHTGSPTPSPELDSSRSQLTELQRCTTTSHRAQKYPGIYPSFVRAQRTGSSTATPNHPRDGSRSTATGERSATVTDIRRSCVCCVSGNMKQPSRSRIRGGLRPPSLACLTIVFRSGGDGRVYSHASQGPRMRLFPNGERGVRWKGSDVTLPAPHRVHFAQI